jgi:hypothetical protein
MSFRNSAPALDSVSDDEIMHAPFIVEENSPEIQY